MTATGWAGLAVDEETVYVSFNSHVIAVNLANGTEKWRFPVEADAKISFYAPPALTENGDLIVGGYDNLLYKIAAATGQGLPLFDQAEGRYVGGPLVSDGMIYAPSADHLIYALDMDGTLAWSFETEEPLWAKPVASPDCNCIYLPSMDHRVYALDAQDGSLLWKTEKLGGSIVSTPTVSEDQKLYVGTFANELVAIDGKDGSILWRFPTTNWVWSGPALFNDILYFGDLNGTLFAVDRQTGQSAWQIQATASIVGQPLVREDGIYFTIEDGTVQAVNFDGTTRWTLPFEASLQAGPLEAGDLIIVATSSPETLLIAINPNGTQVWTYAFERR
jgi:outer membrane protein assembly factor BamB